MQNERDAMSLYVSVPGNKKVAVLLQEAYAVTNQALTDLTHWISSKVPSNFNNKESFTKSLHDFRNQTDYLTYKEVTKRFADDIRVFIYWIINGLKAEKRSDIWRDLVAFHMFVNGKECIGVELSLGVYFFTHGKS